jgi:hypothetical protein
MVDFPSASVTVSDRAAASAKGLETCCVIAPVALNPDITPRMYTSADSIYEQHGYGEGLEYSALHFDGNGKPVLFVGVPIETEGAISREDSSGNTGSCVTTVYTNGCLTEHEGVLTVLSGGTVGTDQIILGLSLDGGFKTKPIRFGTGTSYTEPYANVLIVLGAGTLVEGDTIHTWHGSGPLASTDDIALAWEALAEGQDAFRTAMQIGDVQDATEASAVLDEVNAYETAHERFTLVRCSIPDRLPQAAMSKLTWRMTGAPSLTFAEVGAGSDTITRSTGSWITDGAVVGDVITVTGSTLNNVTGAKITGVSATVLTLGAAAGDDLAAEVAVAGCTVIGSPSLVFAEVGAGSDTITRNRGSWLADGFRVGDLISATGTVSNNITGAAVTGVSATVLTLGPAGADDLAAETIASRLVTLTAGQTKAAWAAEMVEEFEDIDSAPRISLGWGRGTKASPFSGWNFRRSASWAASIREYKHDLHVAPWRKNDGNTGWNLKGLDGKLKEWDDRVDGRVACTNRFTAFRTWSNGPLGAYVALSLTRAEDDSLRVMTHNMNVVNLVQQLTQTATEDALIGVSLDLNDDGTATEAERGIIETRVNAAYELDVLSNKKNEGKRASSCKWTMNTTDILNVPDATVTGVTELNLNGTVLRVNTSVVLKSGGQ